MWFHHPPVCIIQGQYEAVGLDSKVSISDGMEGTAPCWRIRLSPLWAKAVLKELYCSLHFEICWRLHKHGAHENVAGLNVTEIYRCFLFWFGFWAWKLLKSQMWKTLIPYFKMGIDILRNSECWILSLAQG